nr:MAG TPA: hypothetical protein [Caudoviricetes sp.]
MPSSIINLIRTNQPLNESEFFTDYPRVVFVKI